MPATTVSERFLADKAAPFCSLAVAPSFAQLTATEKKYAHFVGQAAWAGARVIQGQSTPHGARLYDLLILAFTDDAGKLADLSALQAKAGLGADDWEALLQYAAQVLSNLSNYKSFGFTKFVPRTSAEHFEAAIKASHNAEKALPLWEELKETIYSVTPEAQLSIGKPVDGHISAYYLGLAPTDAEVAAVQAAAEKLGLDLFNTRVRKDAPGKLALLVASAETRPAAQHTLDLPNDREGKLSIEYGDFADAMAKAAAHLTEAKKYAANEHQAAMLDGYINS
jgi:dipeptidyl-peptidase-3